MDFKFKHNTTGEIRTISLSEKRIQYLLDEYILRDLLVCDCQPIGETNVIECNCADYLDEFELMEREAPNVQIEGLSATELGRIPESSITDRPQRVCLGMATEIEMLRKLVEEALDLTKYTAAAFAFSEKGAGTTEWFSGLREQLELLQPKLINALTPNDEVQQRHTTAATKRPS